MALQLLLEMLELRVFSVTPYQINTTPITLYISEPFTTDHSHTGTYTCSRNGMSSASPTGDTITLNARSEYDCIYIHLL